MSSSIDQIIDQNTNSRTLSPSAVATQVVLMSVISIGAVFTFSALRPRNKRIYEPKVKYHVGNKKPPRISESFLGWIPPLVDTKEAELVDRLGVDAATFLRFLRMMRWLFTCVAILTCAVLVPINITYNLKYVPSDARNILSIMTIRNVGGEWLYVHVAMTYVITGVAMWFIWFNWGHILRMRHQWFRTPEYQDTFHARTLLITHVNKRFQSDEGLLAVFQTAQVPYPTTAVHIGRKVGKLPELIEYHNETVRQFETILVRYLKGGKIAKERPTIRVGGFMGIGGVKKDAIDFYTAKLKRTEGAIEEYRKQYDTRKPENYGFASMAAVPYAHVVAHMLRRKHPKGTDIQLAPPPKDIIWENLNLGPGALARKKTMGFLWLTVVFFFNTVPLFIISVLANLGPLTAYVPFLETWANKSPATFAFVNGVLPPAVSALFGFFLPLVIGWLAKYQGAFTHSRTDRAVVGRYYAFLVVSQLVVFTLIGVIFIAVQQIVSQIGHHESFQEIVHNLDKLPGTINQTYIDQSSYWLTFFPLRGFLVLFDLAQIVNVTWTSFKTHIFGRTPRDIREWTQPQDFQYSIFYSNMLFMGTVALVFAPLAPLVVVAAAVVFWLSSFVFKYQLMFVYNSKVETGGRLWNVVINRLLVSVMLMQVLMILTIGLQYGFKSFTWLSTIPPMIFVLIFKVYINRRFDNRFRYYNPTEEDLQMAKTHSERADHKGHRLEKRFGHPALHAELFTPMLHANMMPLLREVYSGTLSADQARLKEYGGQKMEAQVIPGGIKIAGVDQNDLELDSRIYQRERAAEVDWDARSASSTTLLGSDAASVYGARSVHGGGRSTPALSEHPTLYDQYLRSGPMGQSDIELARFDSNVDQQPLLPNDFNTPPVPPVPQQYQQYQRPAHHPRQPSQVYPTDSYSRQPSPPQQYTGMQEAYTGAPVLRPYPPSRQPSGYTDDSNGNMAGRGAFRNY